MTKTNQQGMAAIMFAMFMVILFSLLSLGFAAIVSRDQRQTLDKTLSNQAQYAAETAINRQARILQANPATAAQPTCATLTAAESKVLTAQLPDVTITCLKWSSQLPDAQLGSVGPAGPVALPLNFSAATSSMRVSWFDASNTATGTYGGATLALANGRIPTLRLTIATPNNVNAATTVYLVPTGAGAGVSAGSDGAIGTATCSAGKCTATVTGLPGGGQNYLVSVMSLNGTSTVTLAATAAGVTVSGAQAEIDATAKSQDVIKRLTARVSLVPTTGRPAFAAQAETLCKNFKLDGSAVTSNTAAGPASTNVCSN